MFILRSIQFQKYYFQTLTCFQSNYLNATFFLLLMQWQQESIMNEGHKWSSNEVFLLFGQYLRLDMRNGQRYDISKRSSI